MRDTHRKITKSFTGRQDSSSHLNNINPEDFIDALNIQNTHDNRKRTLKGNRRIVGTLEVGSKVIGTFEDSRNNSLIYFIWSPTKKHKIIRWYPDAKSISGNGQFIKVAEGQDLEFKEEWIITHIELIDDKYLYWTDAQTTATTIEGNPPRMLDISRSVDQNKVIEYVLAYHLQTSFTDGNKYTVKVYDINHILIFDLVDIYTASGVMGNHFAIIEELRLALQSYDILVENIDEQAIKIYHTSPGMYIEITSNQNDIVFYTSNSYNYVQLNNGEWHPQYDHNLIKLIPEYGLEIFRSSDNDVPSNNIGSKLVQFIYRYNYTDNSKSAWSDMSEIQSDIVQYGYQGVLDNRESLNMVGVIIPAITDKKQLSSLRNIEVAVRNSFEGIFRRWLFVDPYDVSILPKQYSFYGDKIYEAISSDASAVEGTQALKNYDFVPELSGCVRGISDESGNSILILSANKEGKSVEVKFDLEVIQDDVKIYDPTSSIYYSNYLSLKRSGRYGFSIVYGDEYGRRSTVRKGIEYTVKEYPENELQTDYLFPKISIKIKHFPPIWAKYYWIVRTNDLVYSSYVQLGGQVSGYKLKKINDPEDDLCVEPLPIDSEEMDFIGIRLFSNGFTNPDCLAILEWFKGIDEGYVTTFDKEYRIKFLRTLTNDGKDFMQMPGGYDFEILGITTYGGREVLLIGEKHAPIFQNVLIGTAAHPVFEIYKTKTSNDAGFYEVSKQRILNAGKSNRSHAGNIQNQNTTQPAIVSLGSIGDTFIKRLYDSNDLNSTSLPVKGNKETQYMNYVFPESKGNGYGWLNIEDENSTERFYFNHLRVSDTYIPDGRVNGLSAFRGLNFVKINKDFSTIKSLVLLRQVLLVIAERGIQPFYVNRKQIIDIRGNDLLGQTSSLLNMAMEYKSMLGTANPESIAIDHGRVWGYDIYHGTPWRYDNNGTIEIFWNNKEQFETEQIRLRAIGRIFIHGAYDQHTRTYDISFQPVSIKERMGILEIPGRTFAFADYQSPGEEFRGWIGQRSYVPEFYGRVGNKYVSFKNGDLYQHNDDDVPAGYFYGEQFPCKIKFAVNEEHYQKIFWAIRIVSESKWYTEKYGIEILPTEINPLGMKSMLPEGLVKFRNGAWWSAFLRNMADQSSEFDVFENINEREVVSLHRGDRLKGDVMAIELVCTSGELATLQKVDIEIDIFNPTK